MTVVAIHTLPALKYVNDAADMFMVLKLGFVARSWWHAVAAAEPGPSLWHSEIQLRVPYAMVGPVKIDGASLALYGALWLWSWGDRRRRSLASAWYL